MLQQQQQQQYNRIITIIISTIIIIVMLQHQILKAHFHRKKLFPGGQYQRVQHMLLNHRWKVNFFIYYRSLPYLLMNFYYFHFEIIYLSTPCPPFLMFVWILITVIWHIFHLQKKNLWIDKLFAICRIYTNQIDLCYVYRFNTRC